MLPSNATLNSVETALLNVMGGETILSEYIEMIRNDYDFIIIDCSPNLGMLTFNALAAGDEVIIPVQAAYLPVKGLELLLKTISRIQRKVNKKLTIRGILITMVDYRTNYAKNTGVALLKELQDVGLIDLVQQNGKANVIYVKNFISGAEEEVQESDQSRIHTGAENEPAQILNQSRICTGAENEPVRNFNQFKNSTGTDSEMVLGEKSTISDLCVPYEASQKLDQCKFSDDTGTEFETVPT